MRQLKTAIAGFFLTLGAWAQQDTRPLEPLEPSKPRQQLARQDMDFINQAAVGGLAEVEMGKLALKNGGSKGVKTLGQRLIVDHTKANEELDRAVAAFAVPVPTRVDTEHQAHLDMLTNLRGAEFDTAFSKHMVEGHQKMIDLFKKQVDTGEAKALRDYAQQTLPVLEAHLKIAQELSRSRTTAR